MDHEAVLLESRTMRGSLVDRTEALDRVRALGLLPDGLHATRSMVAAYFDVDEEAVRTLVRRHREELAGNGMALLKGAGLRGFLGVNMTPRKPPGRGLLVFPRRAVLNVAMLLRDSEVARQVRRHLFDLAQAPVSWPEAMAAEIAQRATPGPRGELAELREAYARLARQLEVERAVVAAMGVRVADTACEVPTLGGRVDMLCTLGTAPGPGRRRCPGSGRR
ncbi:hypothetical protein [Saccharothrix sp. ST-888]|uniref:hypothetical protein n=1 Tax=Saccharothrix sp. ST-888 TaxID=1427391 RepID=UPI000696051A|nr:hypothetical protein [Saccharothrix sp. ST-888]